MIYFCILYCTLIFYVFFKIIINYLSLRKLEEIMLSHIHQSMIDYQLVCLSVSRINLDVYFCTITLPT